VECGAPLKRIVEKKASNPQRSGDWKATGENHRNDIDRKGGFYDQQSKTIGWKPTCSCTGTPAPKPCVVLDPFMGAGTVGLVCEKLNRKWLGIELGLDYCAMAKKRIMPEASQLKWC
jgi:hypothetical protein